MICCATIIMMMPATHNTFMVGGAVRDELLGLAVRDRDWVVVGSTEQSLLDEGFVRVGLDFPVFLHPVTKEEYALARTERKSGPGYKGFQVHADPSVTLEQDLSRRDLTVNAIAKDGAGVLIDPFGGVADLRSGVLRHVSEAFREDPVRVLRVARFAARYPGFVVAAETQALMREMVGSGEVDALVPERVWQEIAKGLMEQRPARMLEVLQQCGALARVLPEVAALEGISQPLEHHPEGCVLRHVRLVLDQAAVAGASLAVRYACLVHDLGKGLTPAEMLPRHLGHEQKSESMAAQVSARLKVPSEIAGLAGVVAREHGNVHMSMKLNAKAVMRLLTRCDALRRPDRFREALIACECDARGRLGLQAREYPQEERLGRALDAALSADTKAIARRLLALGAKGEAVGAAIMHARSQAIASVLQEAVQT